MAIMENKGRGFKDKLGNSGMSPGYRSANIQLTVCTSDKDPKQTEEIEIMLDKNDSYDLLMHLLEIHKVAWQFGDPVDIDDGEKIPPLIKATLR